MALTHKTEGGTKRELLVVTARKQRAKPQIIAFTLVFMIFIQIKMLWL